MQLARTVAVKLPSIVAASLAALVMLSCGGSDSTAPPTPVAVASVSLTPPTNTLVVAQTVQLTAATKDASGNILTGHAIAWSSSSTPIATVSAAGLVTAVAPGSATIFASSENKSGSASITVTAAPVNAVTVTPPTSTLTVGATVQLTAATTDAAGHTLTGRTITWASTTPSVATTSNVGLVTAVAVGTTNIIATSEGKADTTLITVQTCSSTLSLAVGEIHALTVGEKATLCLSGGSSASEYALVAFNNSTTAASTTPVHFVGTNTSAVLAPLSSRQAPMDAGIASSRPDAPRSNDGDFRAREYRDLSGVFSRMRSTSTAQRAAPPPLFLIGVAPTPIVGAVVQLNTNLSGNSCSDAKVLHPAMVIAVLPHTIVLYDTLSPAGGYSPVEMTAFGQSFDTL
ncbi:MAG: Ig-like domain-containing protein, partial [Gemmatimonadota bacterium]|nr:Ig-like domain-containing protein [Gemmatimonadota bacterium]